MQDNIHQRTCELIVSSVVDFNQCDLSCVYVDCLSLVSFTCLFELVLKLILSFPNGI